MNTFLKLESLTFLSIKHILKDFWHFLTMEDTGKRSVTDVTATINIKHTTECKHRQDKAYCS